MSKEKSGITEQNFLLCEKTWIFILLSTVSGFLGAFTVIMRGGVFCNAQTANFVFMAAALGKGNFSKGLYYLIPITAYFTGSCISEYLPTKIKKLFGVRWDTLLIGFEIIVIVVLALLPESLPVQISQIGINFICSMQYNTFRQAENIPMATTFCTNHLRQTGVFFVKWLKNRDERAYSKRFFRHLKMLLSFVAGGVISSIMCTFFLGKALLGAAILLLIIFIRLLHADLTKEKNLLNKIPAGH